MISSPSIRAWLGIIGCMLVKGVLSDWSTQWAFEGTTLYYYRDNGSGQPKRELSAYTWAPQRDNPDRPVEIFLFQIEINPWRQELVIKSEAGDPNAYKAGYLDRGTMLRTMWLHTGLKIEHMRYLTIRRDSGNPEAHSKYLAILELERSEFPFEIESISAEKPGPDKQYNKPRTWLAAMQLDEAKMFKRMLGESVDASADTRIANFVWEEGNVHGKRDFISYELDKQGNFNGFLRQVYSGPGMRAGEVDATDGARAEDQKSSRWPWRRKSGGKAGTSKQAS